MAACSLMMRLLVLVALITRVLASWDLLVELLSAVGNGRASVEHVRRCVRACGAARDLTMFPNKF
jgi:hypothetical protein